MQFWATVISTVAAFASVGGAIATFYWTRRRMIFDTNRELAVFRAEAIWLIVAAQSLDDQQWSIGILSFQQSRSVWSRQLTEKEPFVSRRAHSAMTELSTLLYAAETEVFGFARVLSDDAAEEPEPNGKVTNQTREGLRKHFQSLWRDPHYLTR